MASLFPQTPWSLVAQAADGHAERRAALQLLLEQYWQPVHNTIRFGWDIDEAETDTLVQRFFNVLLRPDTLAKVDPQTTRFRDFLKAQLNDFMRARDAEDRTVVREPLLLSAPIATPATTGDPDTVFDEQWVLLVFHRALERLRSTATANGPDQYRVFEARDIHGNRASDADLARELGIPPGNMAMLLKEARRSFRRYVTAEVQQYTAEEPHAREELKWLLP